MRNGNTRNTIVLGTIFNYGLYSRHWEADTRTHENDAFVLGRVDITGSLGSGDDLDFWVFGRQFGYTYYEFRESVTLMYYYKDMHLFS